MGKLRGLRLLLLAVVLTAVSWAKKLEVKWAEGTNRQPDRGLSEKNYYLEHKEPEGLMHGPEALFYLNGMCFETSVDRYLYRVCPFQNVTMRRITASRATLIGHWMEWSDDFRTQQFSMGQSCGGKTRTAAVLMQCLSPHDVRTNAVKSFPTLPTDAVKEEGSCHHSFILELPLACRLLEEAIVPPEFPDDTTQVSDPSLPVAAAEPPSSESFATAIEPEAVSGSSVTEDVLPHSSIGDGDNSSSSSSSSSSNSVESSMEKSDNKEALLWALQAKIEDLQQTVADLLQSTPSAGNLPDHKTSSSQ